MNLRDYLHFKRISVTDFAKKIKFTRVHISKVVNETRKPGKHLADIIETATNGEVTAEELLKGEK